MRNLNARLNRLEGAKAENAAPFSGIILDGTRAEVELRLADLSASGGNTIARVVVPHVGESINDFRRAAGLEPLAVPGWNEPYKRENTL
ncbi:hypothetical protein H261_19214 [Paramagnetospirillum caucaseum]|uniref:Uncharacterized protein n=1 Tax=Paramagnetospirillum caucaseum TaxID=1244869 RepID=M2Y5A6_9PROT|nr:hypothetical protein [Paramagnetospirillum caucaseum]EME68271.1 hypothetical protein H261_19214 [Paramagnetospirillum caucaseum]